MKISELKVYLDELSKKEIEKLVTELYQSNTFNQELIQNKIHPEDEEIKLEKYKTIIRNEFFPERGDGKLRYAVMRKALSNFKKISNKPENIADLMLCYVENGVEFTNEFGDIDDNFYTKMGNMFADSLKYIFEHGLEELFEERCLKIKSESDNIGWGFSDYLDQVYWAYYDYQIE